MVEQVKAELENVLESRNQLCQEVEHKNESIREMQSQLKVRVNYKFSLNSRDPLKQYLQVAYQTGQSINLTMIGNPVFTLSRGLSFPYHMINETKGENGAYLLSRRLQYL